MKTTERQESVLPQVDDATRREFLVAASGLLLLPAACGRDGSTREPASGETRTVEGPTGPVDIPVNPRRVVPGYTTDIDTALVLDLPLIGIPGSTGRATQAIASYQPEEELADLEKITTSPEPNLEQIAALRPDVIVDSYPYEGFEDRYENFSRIAPTLNFGSSYGEGWKTYLRAVAGAFERETLAEEFVSEYEARASELRERVSERWPDARFALITSFESGVAHLHAEESQPARILHEDLGLKAAAAVPETFEGEGSLSLERLDRFTDADIILMYVIPAQEGEGRDPASLESIEGMRESLLWRRLPAVEEGNVFEYDAELYYDSPLSATAFLDWVEKNLLG